MRGLRLWSFSSLWTIGLKKSLFSCVSVFIKVPFTKTAGWAQIPLVLLFCFGLVLLKSFFFFYVVAPLCASLFFWWKCSDRDECERDIWGKRSLRHHNTHAGNSEHIYHFSWRFVQFSSMQLRASVPKDVASCIQGRSQNPSLHFRGDCDSQNPTVPFFHIVLLKVAMKIHTHSHAQINTLLKVVHQCDTTHKTWFHLCIIYFLVR